MNVSGNANKEARYVDLMLILERILDPFIVVCAAFFAYIIRYGFELLPIPLFYLALILVTALLAMLVFPLFNLYPGSERLNLIDAMGRVFLAWGIVLVLIATLLFLSKTGERYSRLWFLEWALLSLALFWGLRVFTDGYFMRLKKQGIAPLRVAVYGARGVGEEIFSRLKNTNWSEFTIAEFLDDDPHMDGARIQETPVSHLSDDALVNHLYENNIDELWIALPLKAEERVVQLIAVLRDATIHIRYLPDVHHLRLLNLKVREVAGLPILDLSSSPMDGVSRVVKMVEDYLISVLVLLLLLPLMLLIAIAIKMDSFGPVLFRQKRNGWQGEEIEVLKFRTMYVHEEPDGELHQATRNDPRITRIGAYLRKWSLDELPQFFNVLMGDMSVVGPRPHAIEHNNSYKQLVDRYALRHKVKPGVTGWAQVNGYRGETDSLEKMEKRIEYDLYYIQNWTFWLDIKIIIFTIFRVFRDQFAY